MNKKTTFLNDQKVSFLTFIHLSQGIFIAGLSLSEAFTSIFYLVFFSLFFGYMMIKTENVAATAIFHTLFESVSTLI